MDERTKNMLYNVILAWYEDSMYTYEGLNDEDFIDRVCEKTGMTTPEYLELMDI